MGGLAMKFPNQWRQCKPFVEAMLERKYINKQLEPYLSPGVMLYLYEAFQDGCKTAKSNR